MLRFASAAIVLLLFHSPALAQNRLAIELNVPELNAKPPLGWKDHVPKDRTYIVWIPTNAMSQREYEETRTLNGFQFRFNFLKVVVGRSEQLVVAEIIAVGAPQGAIKRADGEAIMRDLLLEVSRGRLIDQVEVHMGVNIGREYRIELGQQQIRARVFVVNNRLVMIESEGSRAFVESEMSNTYLDSCRLTIGTVNGPPRVNPSPPPIAGPSLPPPTGPAPPESRRSGIQGGIRSPEFTDEGPAGSLLAGVEVGIGRFGDSPVVHALRPVYREGSNESYGAWHGPTDGKEMQRFVAKPGYAVGAVTVKNGLTVDGMSLTFYRIADGRLDLNDSYDSQWIGGQGGGAPVKISGNGRLVVGLIGWNKPELSGLGLVYPDPTQVPPGTTRASTSPSPSAPISYDASSQPSIEAAAPASSDAAPVKSSRLPIVLLVVGGIVFFLAVVGGAVYYITQNSDNRRGRRRL